jgi:hypothetical protein
MDDYEAIRQLTARYNRASDEADVGTWLNCFAPNGSFERKNGQRFSGRDELRGLLENFPVRGRHITSDFTIEVDGDRARQACYLLFLDRDRNFELNMFGTYDDQLIKVDGNWFFVSRVLDVDDGSDD